MPVPLPLSVLKEFLLRRVSRYLSQKTDETSDYIGVRGSYPTSCII